MGARALMAVIAGLECQELGCEERRSKYYRRCAVRHRDYFETVDGEFVVLEVCLERGAYAFHAMPH